MRLAALARAAAAEERGGPEWLEEHPAIPRAGWEQLIDDDDALVLVATLDEVIVGGLHASLDVRVLQVRGIWVEPEAREVGLGELLLETALGHGTRYGAAVAESFALPGDRATKNLFERFGMKARLLVVRRRLDGAP